MAQHPTKVWCFLFQNFCHLSSARVCCEVGPFAMARQHLNKNKARCGASPRAKQSSECDVLNDEMSKSHLSHKKTAETFFNSKFFLDF